MRSGIRERRMRGGGGRLPAADVDGRHAETCGGDGEEEGGEQKTDGFLAGGTRPAEERHGHRREEDVG